MLFGKSKNFYTVTHISGPTHNFLAVKLTFSPLTAEPSFQVLPSNGNCHCGPLNQQDALECLLRGLKEVNQQANTQYQIAEAHFVASDSDNPPIYSYMIKQLIERIEAKEEFTVSNYGDK